MVSPHCSLWHLVKGVPRQGAKERTSGGCELVCSGYHSKKADMYFLTGLEAGTSRSRCQHGWVLESSLPLGCRWPATLLLCPCMTSSLCSGGEGVSSPLSLLRDCPYVLIEHIYFLRGPISKYKGLGLPHMNLGDRDIWATVMYAQAHVFQDKRPVWHAQQVTVSS